ncbi:MAG: hypothetical protein HC887_00200 [Desulfobacteraceae bacterium]|nr:hypothetical protein [Desulfobacteraceae bacterium]
MIIENAKILGIEADITDQIFEFMVRDFSKYALQLYSKPGSTPKQMELCMKMIRKPALNKELAERVWTNHVYALNGVYKMND